MIINLYRQIKIKQCPVWHIKINNYTQWSINELSVYNQTIYYLWKTQKNQLGTLTLIIYFN